MAWHILDTCSTCADFLTSHNNFNGPVITLILQVRKQAWTASITGPRLHSWHSTRIALLHFKTDTMPVISDSTRHLVSFLYRDKSYVDCKQLNVGKISYGSA